MGTSTGYDAPTTPQWAAVKNEVTRAVNAESVSSATINQLISKLITANGGAHGISHGHGVVGGSSARRIGKNFAAFISSVATFGLTATLKEAGLPAIGQQSVIEFTLSLVSYLGGSSNTIDDSDARNALSQLVSELFEQVQTPDEITAMLDIPMQEGLLNEWLCKFFAYTIYQQFNRIFYERLLTRIGNEPTEAFLKSVLDCICSQLRLHTVNLDISHIDWTGPEGENLITNIHETTLCIFEG